MSRQDTSIDLTALDDDSAMELSDNDPGLGLLEILPQLAGRKWFIAKVVGGFALCGLAFALLTPNRYTATTKIMTPQQSQSTASMLMNQLSGAGGNPLAAMASGGLALKSPNDAYIGLLGSRSIADAIVQKFDLVKVYGVKDEPQARKILSGSSVITSEKNGFISVSVTDEDKERAAAMANAYTDGLRSLTKSLAVTEAGQRRLFYEEQLKQSKETLVAAALAFQQVQQQKGLVQLDAQAKAMIEGLASLRAQVAAKRVEVQALRSYSTEQNPDLQMAEKELASIEAEEARLQGRSSAPGIAGLGLDNIPSAGLEYLRAQHELQYQQALYDMLMKQYEAAKLDESKEGTIIQVVEQAIPPDTKSSPHRALMVLLFIGLGFVGACSYVYLSDATQKNPKIAQSLAEFKAALFSR
jgi:uncharacterized protein involved in exopolysaccharide biosynthesis